MSDSSGSFLHARVLGSLEVRRGEQPVETGPVRQRVILALLLLNAGRPVPRSRLVDVLWADPPANAVNKVQGYVAALRNALEPGRRRRGKSILRYTGSGYCLDVPRDLLDLSVFDDLIHAAAGARPEDAVESLLSALRLWRGDVLADLGEAVATLPEVQAVRSRHRQAVLLAATAAGDRADNAALVPHLVHAGELAPLDEEVHAALVVALHRCGRRAEALHAFHSVRCRLTEELGVGPSARLSEAYQQVLHPEADPSVPAQLPPDVPRFVGRTALVESVSRKLTEVHQDAGVVLLSGVAGAGKTALAVRVAHLVAEEFPDGQVFADLAGTGERPADPGEVLSGFLRALGVPDDRVPAALPARTAMFRSLLAHRRILVVLDNAHDATQVRPLLPGSATNAVLLTSRSHLAALDVADRVDVGELSTPEAVELLATTLGEPLDDGAGAVARELAVACGRLPLALRIAAGRILLGSHTDLSSFTGLLRDERARLDELKLDDLAVRSSFMLSYRRLDAAAARTFRLLATAACSAPSTGAATAMLEVEPNRLARLLEPLVDAHLVRVGPAGRCEFHRLVRVFGRERARDEDPERQRGQAQTRLAGWYLAMLRHAVDTVHNGPDAERTRKPGATSEPRFPDSVTASAWLDDNEADLFEVIHHAIGERLVTTTVALDAAERFGRYFAPRGHPGHYRRLREAALDRACAEDDADDQELAAIGIGAAEAGEPESAFERLSRAVERLDRSGAEPSREQSALATLERVPAHAQHPGLMGLVADVHDSTWRCAGDPAQAIV